MSDQEFVRTEIKEGVGEITFHHPRGNSLPRTILTKLSESIDSMGADTSVRVVVLRSEGDSSFCGGASFDELLRVKTVEQGQEFFSGFAQIILSIRKCPKFVIARVHSKAVGGGVGLVAACDYAFATEKASVRLSELAIGIGPFTIGPAVERKLGKAAFSELAISATWRDAPWAHTHGLYSELFPNIETLDIALAKLLKTLTEYSQEASKRLKMALWEGTYEWEEVLAERVRTTSRLVLTADAQSAIARANSPKK